MTLYETAQEIIKAAEAQPNVGLAYCGDIYDLNERQDINYPAVVVTQNVHTEAEDFRMYSFYVFYADRLTTDKDNRLEVQSIAIEALSNIFKKLGDVGFEIVGDIRYHTFDERFDAEAAGAYAEITLQAEEWLCSENY